MDHESGMSSSAGRALRYLARGQGRDPDGRPARIVAQALRAGRLRLALLVEELATAAAVEPTIAAPRARALPVVLAEVEAFRRRLGARDRAPAASSLRELRAACARWVSELVAADGNTPRQQLLAAHVALCDGRAAEARAILESLAALGSAARRIRAMRVRARLATGEPLAALDHARAGLAVFPNDPWLAVATAAAAVAADEREVAGEAFERVRSLGSVGRPAALAAVPWFTAAGWSEAAAREAFASG